MQQLNHSFATEPVQIRRAIEVHRSWIETQLGVSLSEAAIVKTNISFHNAAITRLLGYHDSHAPIETSIKRLTERLHSVDVPASFIALIGLSEERAIDIPGNRFSLNAKGKSAYSLDWIDGPVMLRLRGLDVPIVAASVDYFPGPDSSVGARQDVILIRRDSVHSFISLLKTLTESDGKARLKIGYEDAQLVTECEWSDLVLNANVASLLRDDFESFFEREAWFRQVRLPYRRGYLLHGPPGNGKSTAIRAMMTSRSLTAYTIRFFDEHTDDHDLDRLFARAAQNAPAMILLEDIDRVFPREGGEGRSKTKVSLQQLLNNLDGVGSGEGVITVATANEPTALDAAILKRPGRFDRVVLFPNPTPDLRRDYFTKMDPSFAAENQEDDLKAAVSESEGFSFAQLREAYIMAGQAAFVGGREIVLDDLLNGIWALRRSLLFNCLKSPGAGFATPTTPTRNKQER